MQGRILARAKLDRLSHEKPAEQVLVFAGGCFERLQYDSLREPLRILVKQNIVPEDCLSAKSRKPLGKIDQAALTGDRFRHPGRREIEGADI